MFPGVENSWLNRMGIGDQIGCSNHELFERDTEIEIVNNK